MRRLNVWVCALVLLMGIGFTSCIDSENSTTARSYVLVKVRSSLGSVFFEDSNGFRLYPTAASLATVESELKFEPSSTNLAYIGYQYDTATQPITESTTSLNVELLYAVSLDATFESVEEAGASNDSISNAPIISLKSTGSSYYTYEPVMFDSNTLLLTVNYYMNSANHYFTLVHYLNEEPAVPEESVEGDETNTVTLYLRHNNGGDTSTSGMSQGYVQSYPYVFYKAFNLSSLRLTPGTKLVIKTQESSNSVSLEGATENSYEVEIKSE